MAQTIDKSILLAAKNGDLGAFEKILLALERPIFNYIYRILKQRQDAEDLTQETFIKLYKKLGSLDPEKGIKSWIYKIATNTAYDWLRRQQRRPVELLAGENIEDFETFDSLLTYDNTEGLADTADLAKALDTLKPVHKTVLLLFYQQDMSYQEIAELLSLPLNTVKTHLYRAKSALKQELTKNLF